MRLTSYSPNKKPLSEGESSHRGYQPQKTTLRGETHRGNLYMLLYACVSWHCNGIPIWAEPDAPLTLQSHISLGHATVDGYVRRFRRSSRARHCPRRSRSLE